MLTLTEQLVSCGSINALVKANVSRLRGEPPLVALGLGAAHVSCGLPGNIAFGTCHGANRKDE
jgi:hypothetical protein